jgi:hypothetical protein
MWRAILVSAILFFALAGCHDATPATFGGKVTHQGKPIASGVIFFHGPAPAMQMGMGTIADGKYTATDVPLGQVKVSFQAPGVPEKFADPNKSELSFAIVPSMNTLDIEIP